MTITQKEAWLLNLLEEEHKEKLESIDDHVFQAFYDKVVLAQELVTFFSDPDILQKLPEKEPMRHRLQMLANELDNAIESEDGDHYGVEIITFLKSLRVEVKRCSRKMEQIEKEEFSAHLISYEQFIDLAKSEFECFLFYNVSSAMMLIGIDHFKKICEQYGADIQETIVSDISKKIINILRRTDIITYLGKGRFLILLSNAEIDSAKLISKRIIKLFSTKETVLSDGKIIPLTVCMGISHFSLGDEQVKDSIDRSLVALKKAKKNGQNKISTY